jgi:hypothetical protein
MLIKKYSTLSVYYPNFSDKELYAIPNSIVLPCLLDSDSRQIIVDQKKFSQRERFVFLYLQTRELVQICVDIYNQFERKEANIMIPLKHGI